MSMNLSRYALTGLLCCLLLQLTARAGAQGDASQPNAQPQAPAVPPKSEDLQQLVAPIALYPDALVAQILAASEYPTEIVEADRWVQSHPDLKDEKVAGEIDKQPWDPSVKALTQFPSVLQNMDKNLSWTSSLGDAYANQQQDVMDAVQAMREQARKAGHLNSNEQEKVMNQGNTIVIEPATPDVVYVPQYDPWLVYGYPIVAYPGWYPVPGIFYDGPGLFFGGGFGIGYFGGFGWGWHHWGWDWHDHRMLYNHNTYISHSRTIINRNEFGRGGFNHDSFHGGVAGHPDFHAQGGMHSGAFSGFDHGGNVRGFSSRGQSSVGGGFHGGGFHGGGGFHDGGGFHGGGGGHR